MKKLLSMLCVLAFIPSTVFASPSMMEVLAGVVSQQGGTDFTQDANCMGAWYMNSTSTSELDRSGNSADLAYINTPATTNTVPTTPVYSGNSLDFERTTQEDSLFIADGGSTDISGSEQSMTVSAWVKPESTSEDYFIVTKYDYGNDQRQFDLQTSGSTSYKFAVSSDGTFATGADSVSTSTAPSIGTWVHVVGVYNAETDLLDIYINGVKDATSVSHVNGIHDGTSTFNIGAIRNSTAPAGWYDGLIDEAIIFDRVLSVTEILSIYNNGIDGSNGGND